MMKKVLFAAALMLTMGISAASAATGMYTTNVQCSTLPDYQKIEIKDLPSAVQESISKNYPEHTITGAAVEEKDGVKTYEVKLADKDGAEKTVIFNENGEESTK